MLLKPTGATMRFRNADLGLRSEEFGFRSGKRTSLRLRHVEERNAQPQSGEMFIDSNGPTHQQLHRSEMFSSFMPPINGLREFRISNENYKHFAPTALRQDAWR